MFLVLGIFKAKSEKQPSLRSKRGTPKSEFCLIKGEKPELY